MGDQSASAVPDIIYEQAAPTDFKEGAKNIPKVGVPKNQNLRPQDTYS